MHVAQRLPDTWAHRTVDAIAARLDFRARFTTLYAAFSGRKEILAGLRRQGARVVARFAKARSATQTPSAGERLGEDMAAASIAGATTPELLRVGLEFTLLAHALDPAPVTRERVLAAIAESDRAEAAEQIAESDLLTDPARELAETRLEELEVRTRASIAADLAKADLAGKLRRQLRGSRQAAKARSFRPHFGGGLAS